MIHTNNRNWFLLGFLYRWMAIKISTHNVHTSIVATLCMTSHSLWNMCFAAGPALQYTKEPYKADTDVMKKEMNYIEKLNFFELEFLSWDLSVLWLSHTKEAVSDSGIKISSQMCFSRLTRYFVSQFSAVRKSERRKNRLHNIHSEHIICEMC